MRNAPTPSPAKGPYFFDPVELTIDDAGGNPVADVCVRDEPTDESDETSGTGWLLAAAPDMRDALIAIRNDCDRWLNDDSFASSTDLIAAFFEEASKAITKANGG